MRDWERGCKEADGEKGTGADERTVERAGVRETKRICGRYGIRIRLKEVTSYILLGLLTVVLCISICGMRFVFGAKVDWISQHSVLPEYFRQQFYQTGNLFPEFAAQLGGGQNIYNYSYYGLYSPVILLSYLLPFVEMGDYLMAAGVTCLAAAVMIFYRWLLKRGIDRRIAFFTSCMFLLAGPMVYHSYHQVMFVIYMPFLCSALTALDEYFETGRTVGYTVSVFLMIMTSFYFSIGGMLVLVLYGLFRYVQLHELAGEPIWIRDFLLDGCRFLFSMINAVLMSAILLIPTTFCLTGRSHGEAGAAVEVFSEADPAVKALSGSESIAGNLVEAAGHTDGGLSIIDLLLPRIEVLRFVYSPYGIGLTTLVLTVLITGCFYRKRSEKMLHIGCLVILTVPVFAWLLNGGLYIRDKVMIPFLPLLCYLTANYMEKLKSGRIPFLPGAAPYLVTLIILWAGRTQEDLASYWILVVAEGVLTMFVYLFTGYRAYHVKRQKPEAADYTKTRKEKWNRAEALAAFSVLILLGYEVGMNYCDAKMLDRSFYEKVTSEENRDAVRKALREEDGFYRIEQYGTTDENAADINRIWDMNQYISSIYSSTYNEDYQSFRTDTFDVEQPYRNVLMQPTIANPVFQKLMGIRYVISDKEVPGYEKVDASGSLHIYKRANVLPIIYSTDRTIPESIYRKLEFPYNQAALARYAVVPDEAASQEGRAGQERKQVNAMQEEVVMQSCGLQSAPFVIPDQAKWMQATVDGYQIRSDRNRTVEIPITLPEDADTLFLRFQVCNQKEDADVSVWLEGVKNKLSADGHIYYNNNTEFTYAIPLKPGQDSLEMRFGKGEYMIIDIECMTGTISELPPAGENEMAHDMSSVSENGTTHDMSSVSENGTAHDIPSESENKTAYETSDGLCQSSFHIDREKSTGNRITGDISVADGGWLITSIPYDENFRVEIDGKDVPVCRVNTAFLGVQVESGEYRAASEEYSVGLSGQEARSGMNRTRHQVEIIYHAPGVLMGKILSCMGGISFMIHVIVRRRRSMKENGGYCFCARVRKEDSRCAARTLRGGQDR